MTGKNATPLVGWHPAPDLVPVLARLVEQRGGGRGTRSEILNAALRQYLVEQNVISETGTVYWHLVRGESPDSRAVEPADAIVPIPAEVLEWAEARGLDPGDPDVYILVTTEPGSVAGSFAQMEGTLPVSDVAGINEAIRERESIRLDPGAD